MLRKGLLVIRLRLLRSVVMVGALAATAVVGVSVTAAAAPVKAARTAKAASSTKSSKATTVTKARKAPRASKAVSSVRATQRRARVSAGRRRISLARAREQREAQQPRFKLDEAGDLIPDVRAEAAIVYDPLTGRVLYEENSQLPRSIASITKVMTAAVFLEDNPDLSQQVMVASADVRGASVTHLRAYERVSLQNLLHLLLIASDNAAARTLARVSPYGASGFVVRMNQKAEELGLQSTRYADSSGLVAENVSSAYDMARLISYAAQDELISTIMRTEEFSFRTSRRALTIRSTNQLLRSPGIDVRGGKTGFITRSGYCLATLLRLPDLNQTLAVVVLGAKSNAGRFWETRHLLTWISSKASGLVLPGRQGQQAPEPHQTPQTPHH